MGVDISNQREKEAILCAQLGIIEYGEMFDTLRAIRENKPEIIEELRRKREEKKADK